MIVGVDFDNTIVCYDRLLHRLAVDEDGLPGEIAASKAAVRDWYRASGRDADWTRLQGIAYGARIAEAEAFPGVREFLVRCRRDGIPVYVVSHRTKAPVAGPPCDLHEAARGWLQRSGFFGEAGLAPDRVFFEETKEAKLRQVGLLGCSVFVDDLPEFLAEEGFPRRVRRILFDPHDRLEWEGERADSWGELERMVPQAAAALADAGLRRDAALSRLRGGVNNRVYLVEDGPSRAVLKIYFRDARRRAQAEYQFTRFAWDRGVERTPRPLAFDPEGGIGLYERIDGRVVRREEVGPSLIREAADFVAAVNRHRDHPDAAQIPPAADACRTVEDHVQLATRRMERARRIDDAAAAEFVAGPLQRAWDAYPRRSGPRGADPARLCLSPSDFGFHNALVGSDGALRFLDFEYAGWDDPAKLICDFLSQPEYPVARDMARGFVEGVTAAFPDADAIKDRVSSLLPLHWLKWCCILLNDFVAEDRGRRRFALGRDREDRLRAQLRKAEAHLARMAEAVAA